MVKSFETQLSMGMQQEGEADEIKRIFLEGNPYLLVRAPKFLGLCVSTPESFSPSSTAKVRSMSERKCLLFSMHEC